MPEVPNNAKQIVELAKLTLKSTIKEIPSKRDPLTFFSGLFQQRRNRQICAILERFDQGSYSPAFMKMESLARIWRSEFRHENSAFMKPMTASPNHDRAVYLSGVADVLAMMIVEGQTSDLPQDVDKVRKYLKQRANRHGKLKGQIEIMDSPDLELNIQRLIRMSQINIL